MKIKRFHQLNEGIEEFPKDTREILNKLEEGYAILVHKEDLGKFYKSVSYYDWIEYEPELNPEDCPDKMYWVLIGRRILHTDKPSFGGYEFDVYEPNFK